MSVYLPTLDKYDSIIWQRYDASSSEWYQDYSDNKYVNKTEYHGTGYYSWER
jgi:hypothetical protein